MTNARKHLPHISFYNVAGIDHLIEKINTVVALRSMNYK